jgi:ubiquinone/menaquinone biosynthesis C-methylase UbiE
MESRRTRNGPISVLYTNMTDLSEIPDGSMDLVWMGQAIEHISEADSFLVYREVKRVLQPGGHFCLDTPNRNLTELQTTGWIHPEHQIEYKPEHLRSNLVSAGFGISLALGICEMSRSWRTGLFDYTDFYVGAAVSANLPACYIQYYDCSV